ncbi:hypothetical protein X777_16239, partial [Ooceraea biroi]
TKILMTLPGKFNPLITAWDSVPVKDQTRANLIERLIKEEQRLTVMDATEEALATSDFGKRKTKVNSNKKFQNSSSGNIKSKKEVECYF